MSAYHVADASDLIKLDAMENPYQWPPELTQRWLEKISYCPINRYPDPDARGVVEQLMQLNPIPDDCSILLGNGSDEIIQLLLMAQKTGASVLTPEPGFVMYKQVAASLGLEYHGIPLLADDFQLDLNLLLQYIETRNPEIIFIAYPNNPTGNLFDRKAITAIIEKSQGLVIIDEAYAPFANDSFMPDLSLHPNLMVMRTVSKLGLAGLRLGYLIGKKNLIEQLNKIRLPYNINSLTQISAEFALSNYSVFQEQTDTLCQERTFMLKALSELPKLKVFPSAANFILVRGPENSAGQLFEYLKTQGILIKNTSSHGGLLKDTLRITIGTPEQNQRFLSSFKNGLAQF